MADRVKKRWANHYADGNPFDLPNAVSRGVREAASSCHCDESDPVRYLWVHYSSLQSDCDESDTRLSRDEWFGVIDEAASLGVRLAIVSLSEAFTEVPDLMAVAQWAQTTHDLMVGFHLYGRDVARGDVRPLAKLNPELTRVFVESEQIDKVRFIEDLGVRVLPSDNIDKNVVAPTCELPKSMTCVCAEGGLYTCGRVAGDQHYHMGNFLGRKLKAVMNDESVPHEISDREAETPERCSGCPPLMAQRIHEDTQ